MSYEPMDMYEMNLRELINENNDLRLECDELRELIGDMHSLLQRICESRDDCCEFWQDRTKQCYLRDIEDKMRELGIGVQE